MIQISLTELPLWVSCIFFLLSMAFMYRQNKKLKKELNSFLLQQSIINENNQSKLTEITEEITEKTDCIADTLKTDFEYLQEKIAKLETLPCAMKMRSNSDDDAENALRGFQGFMRGFSMVVGRAINDFNDTEEEDDEGKPKTRLSLEQQLKIAEDNQEFEEAAKIAALIKQKKGRQKR